MKEAGIERTRESMRVTWVGLFVNIALALLKMIAGLIGRSSALIADSVHSLSDLATDVVVLFGIKAASKPEDEGHDYGHGKFETLVTLLIGLFLIFVGLGILYSSGKNIFHVIGGGGLERPGIIAVIAAAISIIMKEAMFWYTKIVADRWDSKALIANAWHHRTDSLSSVATFLGVGGAILIGGKWSVLDPIAACLVSFLIFWVSICLIKGSLGELMEASLDHKTEEHIMEIARSTKGVIDPHNLKTRSIGNRIAIDIHIKVNRDLSVARAHCICQNLEDRLIEEYGAGTLVNVHIDPDDI